MSETYYKPMAILCTDDNVTRSVRVKCYRFDGSFAADTFFSVPANTRVRGKYVHGFVGNEDGALYFRAHTVCKHLMATGHTTEGIVR
jgi:hypothetical protein